MFLSPYKILLKGNPSKSLICVSSDKLFALASHFVCRSKTRNENKSSQDIALDLYNYMLCQMSVCIVFQPRIPSNNSHVEYNFGAIFFPLGTKTDICHVQNHHILCIWLFIIEETKYILRYIYFSVNQLEE